MTVNKWKSYLWTADKEVKMKVVLVIMNKSCTGLNLFQASFSLLLKGGSIGFFERAGSGARANIARALKVPTRKQTWRFCTIAPLLSKRVCLHSLPQYSFYEMESRVSSNVPLIFIGLLRLKRKSAEKKTPWERLPKGDRLWQIRKFTLAQI